MRVNTAPTVGSLRTDETLSAVLSPTHDVWVEEARQLLVSASLPGAASWERWSVVRYLSDQFPEHFNAERALVAALRPFVTAREMEMLEMGEEQVARLHLMLDRLGRRRGTAVEFARLGAEFLKALELWCVEVELAAARVEPDALPIEAQRILSYLGAPLRMPCRALA